LVKLRSCSGFKSSGCEVGSFVPPDSESESALLCMWGPLCIRADQSAPHKPEALYEAYCSRVVAQSSQAPAPPLHRRRHRRRRHLCLRTRRPRVCRSCRQPHRRRLGRGHLASAFSRRGHHRACNRRGGGCHAGPWGGASRAADHGWAAGTRARLHSPRLGWGGPGAPRRPGHGPCGAPPFPTTALRSARPPAPASRAWPVVAAGEIGEAGGCAIKCLVGGAQTSSESKHTGTCTIWASSMARYSSLSMADSAPGTSRWPSLSAESMRRTLVTCLPEVSRNGSPPPPRGFALAQGNA